MNGAVTDVGFEELFRAEHDRIVAFLQFRIGAAAPDVAAEAFARAWSARDSFDARRGALETWLWAIVRNAATDWLRRRPELDLLGVDVPVDESLDDHAQSVLELAALDRALRLLSPGEREVVALRFGAGYDYRTIGHLLGATEGAIAVRLHRAVHRLRGHIESEAR